MKLVTTILSIILFSTGAYSQRQLLGLDPVSSRPGYIYKDTPRVLNVQAPIEKVNDSTIGLDLSALAAGINGYAQFNTSGALDADSNFYWDNSNKRLGIGTTTPQKTLHVKGKMDLGEYDATLSSLNLVIKDPGSGVYTWRNTNSALSEPFLVLRSGIGTTAPGANSGGGQIRGVQGVPGLRFTDVSSTAEWARFSATGNLGIGMTTPTAKIHIAAPSATANTGQLKLEQGPATTLAETGTFNNSSTQGLVYDVSTTVRTNVALWGYVAKTSSYTATLSDYTIDCTANTFTVTLPTAVGIQRRVFVIKNSGTGVITVATTSSQTIDGSTTQSLSLQYNSITVQSTGSNWIIINKIL